MSRASFWAVAWSLPKDPTRLSFLWSSRRAKQPIWASAALAPQPRTSSRTWSSSSVEVIVFKLSWRFESSQIIFLLAS